MSPQMLFLALLGLAGKEHSLSRRCWNAQGSVFGIPSSLPPYAPLPFCRTCYCKPLSQKGLEKDSLSSFFPLNTHWKSPFERGSIQSQSLLLEALYRETKASETILVMDTQRLQHPAREYMLWCPTTARPRRDHSTTGFICNISY